MARWKRLMLLALPASLLSVPTAHGDSSSSGITKDDQREERFYNFDSGRHSGGGFKDPSDLIRRLQGARNLQRATEPTDTLDAALDDFTWPDEQDDNNPCLVWSPGCAPPSTASEGTASEETVSEAEEDADNNPSPSTAPPTVL